MHASQASGELGSTGRVGLISWAGIAWLGAAVFIGRSQARHPPEVCYCLTKLLYSSISNLLIVGLAGLLSGIYAYVRAGQLGLLVIAGLGFLFVLVRCGMVLLFQRRVAKGVRIDPERWTASYGLTACASSLCWGVVTFSCLAFSHDPVLYLVSVVFTTATAGSIAARNAAAPRIARLQLLLSLLPVMAGAPLADDGGYAFLDVAVPGLIYGLFAVITALHEQLVALYSSELKLRSLSNTDHLTQIANRRHFGECFNEALALRRVSGRPVALLMIDVDHFKGYNDHYGHPAGDRCLQEVARLLQFNLRSTDGLVSRYGGEEFAVLLRDAGASDAVMIAQRLCDAVAEAEMAHLNRKDELQVVTISIGVALTEQWDASSEGIITAADQALYVAKMSGRCRVSVATPGVASPAVAVGAAKSPGPFGPGLLV